MSKPTCAWINHSDFTRRDTMLCGKPVAYRMKKDDDGNSVRVYDTWCAVHMKIAEAQDHEADLSDTRFPEY